MGLSQTERCRLRVYSVGFNAAPPHHPARDHCLVEEKYGKSLSPSFLLEPPQLFKSETSQNEPPTAQELASPGRSANGDMPCVHVDDSAQSVDMCWEPCRLSHPSRRRLLRVCNCGSMQSSDHAFQLTGTYSVTSIGLTSASSTRALIHGSSCCKVDT